VKRGRTHGFSGAKNVPIRASEKLVLKIAS
jgi:hypothetical protein